MDVHDDIGSRMTHLVLNGEVAQDEMPTGSKARAQLAEICDDARGVLASIDEILWALNPRQDNLQDFVHYVCDYTQKFLAPSAIACVFGMDPKNPTAAADLPLRRSVLMDIFLPRMSGIECTARLKMKLPDVQIVMLTAMDNQELLFMALEAGADGYLLKRTKPSELRSALLDVLGGGVPMTSQIACRLIESFRKTAKSTEEATRFCAREEQILQLVSIGHSNKLIADKLDMNYETVCTHLKRFLKKLHVNSKTEAAILYMNSKMSE